MTYRQTVLSILFGTLMAGLAASPSAVFADPIRGVITSGGAAVVFSNFVKTINTAAKSNTCTAAISNGGANLTLPSPANPDPCAVSMKDPDPTKPAKTVNGTGNLNKDKFGIDLSGNTRPLPENRSVSLNDMFEIGGGPPPETLSFWTASGDARAAGGFIGPDNARYTASLSGRAEVKDQIGPSKHVLPATAGAGAEDPFTFTVSGGGSFSVQMNLFGDGVAVDDSGNPIDGLHILSTVAEGRNHFDVSAGFDGPVSVNGQSFSGELFRLVLESSGIVSSVGDVTVSFAAWAGLGLSSQAIQDYETYITNNLQLLADGSIGLGSGSILPLIGAGTPFDPTVTFGTGNVDAFLSIDESAQTVPEPRGAPFLIGGLLATLLVPAGLRRSARRNDRTA